jgi:SAM-dependent methyltransferase
VSDARRVGDPDIWDAHAAWWQAEFTDGADPEYEEQLLPLAAEHLAGCARVLDMGCGEGQVARVLAEGGAAVAGVDPARRQLAAAVARAGGPAYAQGLAQALPFPDAAFDAVVTCLVLEHTDDLAGAVAEASRVLRPGGRYLLFVNHPAFQTPGSGWIDDHVLDPPEQYWRVGEYLTEVVSLEEVDRGVTLPFAHRTVSTYVNALAAVGLYVTHLDEPTPPDTLLSHAPEFRGAAAIPRLLAIVTDKLARPAVAS